MLDFQLAGQAFNKRCTLSNILWYNGHNATQSGGGEMYNLALTLVARFAHDLAELQ